MEQSSIQMCLFFIDIGELSSVMYKLIPTNNKGLKDEDFRTGRGLWLATPALIAIASRASNHTTRYMNEFTRYLKHRTRCMIYLTRFIIDITVKSLI